MSSFKYLAGAKVDEVFDRVSGEVVDAASVARDDDQWILLRTRLKEAIQRGDPLYVCPECHKPVELRSTREKSGQYFVHKDVEGNCPKMQEKSCSQKVIRAIKYNGAKESYAHKETKSFLIDCLNVDPRFSEVVPEKTWRSAEDNSLFRRPDVQALYNGPNGHFKVAFEVQLSSTFLSEIVERREFYRNEGALLVWVFRHFVKHNPRVTELDIFYPNNLNAFVVSSETRRLSLQEKKLQLMCHWAEPVLEDEDIIKNFDSSFVQFDCLTLNQESQQAYWFDYESVKQRIIENKKCDDLRSIVEDFTNLCCDPETRPYDLQRSPLSKKITDHGFPLPDQSKGMISLVRAIKSLKLGRPVGAGFVKLIQFSHLIYESYPRLVLYFWAATNTFDRKETLIKEDSHKKWRERTYKIWDDLSNRTDSKYKIDETYADLVFLIFPEVEPAFNELVVKFKNY